EPTGADGLLAQAAVFADERGEQVIRSGRDRDVEAAVGGEFGEDAVRGLRARRVHGDGVVGSGLRVAPATVAYDDLDVADVQLVEALARPLAELRYPLHADDVARQLREDG